MYFILRHDIEVIICNNNVCHITYRFFQPISRFIFDLFQVIGLKVNGNKPPAKQASAASKNNSKTGTISKPTVAKTNAITKVRILLLLKGSR